MRLRCIQSKMSQNTSKGAARSAIGTQVGPKHSKTPVPQAEHKAPAVRKRAVLKRRAPPPEEDDDD